MLLSHLIAWYRIHGKMYPWRQEPTPYRVWISEIMLQQTTIAAVLPYFDRWNFCFPDIEHLAAAEETEILRLWEGLGYYSRAVNIHKTARIIINQYNGTIPMTYSDLSSLPGIGDYTTRAILSFAFNEPFPAVDANVVRIFSRITCTTNVSREKLTGFLATVIDEFSPSEFNGALMQFGQLVCRSKNPLCGECPIAGECDAFAGGVQDLFPKSLKKEITALKTEILIFWHQNHLLMERRKSGLGKGLWFFPKPDSELLSEAVHNTNEIPLKIRTHVYTRYREKLLPKLIRVANPFEMKEAEWMQINKIPLLPMASTYRKIADDALTLLNEIRGDETDINKERCANDDKGEKRSLRKKEEVIETMDTD